jgi:hypothetical protein
MKIWNALLSILLIAQLSWAPTCGGGAGSAIYYLDNIVAIGLPVQVSSHPVLSIFNQSDNSLIEADLRYNCYSETNCTFSGSHPSYEGYPTPEFQQDVRVLLRVNDSGSVREYYANLRYTGTGGMENCGGPAYRIENITSAMPSSPPYLQIFIALVLVVVICVGLYRMRRDVKKTNRKSKRD